MLVTVIASWLVSSKAERKRHIGFWLFLASNVLWIVWGIGAAAYALVALQLCLAVINIRGERKSEA